MIHHIPQNPSWCVACAQVGGPCQDHRSPDGSAREYTGPDVYEPSSWVCEVVGQLYMGWDGAYRCTGYDPRAGFWMNHLETGRRTNVSERAIDRTYHRIILYPGYPSERLLRMVGDLGRIPTAEETAAVGISLEAASVRLRGYDVIDGVGLTAGGRAYLDTLSPKDAP